MKKFTLDGANYYYSKDAIIEENEKELITEDGEKRIYLYLTVFVNLEPIYESIDFKIYDDGYSTPYGLQSYSEMKLNICKEIFEDKN